MASPIRSSTIVRRSDNGFRVMISEEKNLIVPSHIACVMDGNGRWAKERGLKRTDGHREGELSLIHI